MEKESGWMARRRQTRGHGAYLHTAYDETAFLATRLLRGTITLHAGNWKTWMGVPAKGPKYLGSDRHFYNSMSN